MDIASLHKISQNFTNELIASEKGEKTSLAFIKNTIPSSPLVKDGETFQVMVIGGTNFCNALVQKKGSAMKIIVTKNALLPFFPTKGNFLKFIAEQTRTDISHLALNFGYPLFPLERKGVLDGILDTPSKENALIGLVGEVVGKNIENYVMQKKHKNIRVSVANDTICLLLSAKTKVSSGSIAAGIIGTGLNFAIFLDDTTLVNLEAGDFKGFPQSNIGKAIDNASITKNINIFEKEIAGGYLYKYFNLYLQGKSINFPSIKDTEQLSILAEERHDNIGDFAKEIITRSAQLASCVVAGIANYKKSDMTFVMQGSVFWKGYQYKETVEKTVKQLSPEYTASFINVENADILGAAKLLA